MANDIALIQAQLTETNNQLQQLNTNIQPAVAEMCTAFVTLGESISGSLITSFSSIIPYMDTLVNKATTIQEILSDMWDDSQATSFADAINDTVTGMEALSAALGIVSALITIFESASAGAAISLALQTAATWAQQAATVAVSAAQTVLNAVMSMNPIGMVVLAIGAVIAALVLLWNNCDGFREAVIAIWEKIKEAGEVVWKALCTFFTETVPAAVQVLVDCFNSFVEFWSGIFASIGEFFMDCWNSIIAFATETVPAFIASAK